MGGFRPKRDGVCNPVAYVLCEVTASDAGGFPRPMPGPQWRQPQALGWTGLLRGKPTVNMSSVAFEDES